MTSIRSMSRVALAAALVVPLAAGCKKKGGDDQPAAAGSGSAAASGSGSAAGSGAGSGSAAAPSSLLAAGAEAPEFTAQTFDGKTIDLATLRGKPVVLYFYPKDETPGCTIEAQSFRDEMPDLAAAGIQVIGVSMDSLDAHKEFTEHQKLTFPLIADPDAKIGTLYGVSSARGFFNRVTFVIGPDGTIARVWPKVDPRDHAADVLAAVKGLGGGSGSAATPD
jgi:thioredoxin-dependent peroxiredoxin